jgi:ABC-type phosphate/phosphonate transport system permease subunit
MQDYSHFTPEPPKELLGKIMQRIRKEQRIAAATKLIVFSVMLAGSAIAFLPVYQAMLTGFAESGFTQFFSLLFSDSSAMLAYWQSFVPALLETLPVLSITAFLAILLVFLQSLRSVSRNIKIISSPLKTS